MNFLAMGENRKKTNSIHHSDKSFDRPAGGATGLQAMCAVKRLGRFSENWREAPAFLEIRLSD